MKKFFLLLSILLLVAQNAFSYIHQISLWQNQDYWVLFLKDINFDAQNKQLANEQTQVFRNFLNYLGLKTTHSTFLNESNYRYEENLLNYLKIQKESIRKDMLTFIEQMTLFVHDNTKINFQTKIKVSNTGNLFLRHCDIRGQTISSLEEEVSELIRYLCDLVEIDENDIEIKYDQNEHIQINENLLNSDQYRIYKEGFTSYAEEKTIKHYLHERWAELIYIKRFEVELQKYCPKIYEEYRQALHLLNQIFGKEYYELTISQAVIQLVEKTQSFNSLMQIRDCSHCLLKCIADLSFFIDMNERWSHGNKGIIICSGMVTCNSLEDMLTALRFKKTSELKQLVSEQNILTEEKLMELMDPILGN